MVANLGFYKSHSACINRRFHEKVCKEPRMKYYKSKPPAEQSAQLALCVWQFGNVDRTLIRHYRSSSCRSLVGWCPSQEPRRRLGIVLLIVIMLRSEQKNRILKLKVWLVWGEESPTEERNFRKFPKFWRAQRYRRTDGNYFTTTYYAPRTRISLISSYIRDGFHD